MSAKNPSRLRVVCTLFLSLCFAGSAAAQVNTVAGNGIEGDSGDGGQALDASFKSLYTMVFDSQGNYYVLEVVSGRVRKIGTDGVVTHFAGNRVDGPTTTPLASPSGLAIDASNNVYVSDSGHHCIRKFTPAGVASVYAGTCTADFAPGGFAGDGGQAVNALLDYPTGIAIDSSGNLIISDRNNHRLRKVTPGGIISTIAGNDGLMGYGADGSALSVGVDNVVAIKADAAGNIYFNEWIYNRFPAEEWQPRVRKLSGGQITTIAGTGSPGYAGDGGPATAAKLCAIDDLLVLADGSILVADSCNHRVRRIAGGVITTSAGNGVQGFSGDGGAPPAASFAFPAGLGLGPDAKVYVSDFLNYRIRAYANVAPSAPGAPVIGVAYRGNLEAAVSFQPPANNGGSPISGYTVYSSPAGGIDADAGTTKLQHLVTGLSNGTSYTFTAKATNSTGTSVASAASNAVTPADVPGRPVLGKIFVSSGQAVVNFTPPAANGSPAITGYVVNVSPAAGVDAQAGTTATSHTVTGLQNGSTYTFTVTASNSVGESIPSLPSASLKIGTMPNAPTDVQVSGGDRSAYVQFSPSTQWGDYPVIAYEVTSSPAGGVDEDAGSSDWRHSISGLVNGQAYTFTVRAVTAAGPGAESAPSNTVVPAGVPDAPKLAVAVAGDGSATVTITPPDSDNGRPILGYRVSSPTGGMDDDWESSSLVHHLSALVNGESYVFNVSAFNEVGSSLPTASNAVTPQAAPMAPDAPGKPTATAGNGQATVSFNYPNDHGSVIRGYVVTSSPAGGVDTQAGTPGQSHVVTGLANGTAYTFTVTASNDVGTSAASPPSNPVTPSVPTGPSLSINDVEVVEGNSGTKNLTFTVTMSSAKSTLVTFDATTVDVSANQNGDYSAKSATGLRISAGSTSKQFVVPIIGDTTGEPTETFAVIISNASGAAISDAQGIGTIVDDDAAAIPSISIGDVTVTEGNSGSQIAAFTVSLSAASASDVSFDLATANGTATAGSDYVAQSVSKTIPAGMTTLVLQVAVLGDTTAEANEQFSVSMANVVGANVTKATGVATITDDDSAALPQLAIDDVSFVEGNNGNQQLVVMVWLTSPAPADVTFDLATTNGTATAGSDYLALAVTGQKILAGQASVLIPVTIVGDTAPEPNETFTFTVSNVTGATVADGTATGTITNDDAASGPTLSIGDVTIAEGNSGTSVANFTVTLSAAQSGPVNFDIATANGTATAGSDYVAKASTGLRIAAGSTTKTFAVTINGDTTQEANETFFVNLTNAIGATIADGQATGTITNDDAAATPTLSIADASVSEGNSGTKTLSFTVSLSPSAPGTVSYDIATSNGTATAGSDYVASSLTGQTIAAGATSKTFAVTINGDTSTEANETFNVTLGNVSGATLGDGNAIGTITNDDGSGGSPTLTIADVSMAEGNSLSKQMTFTVKLSAAASGPVTYSIATANGTAVAPADYAAKSLTGQSIAAGATSKTFTVSVKGDTVAEANETFKVNVTGVTGATLGDGQATGTITNDDAGRVGIARFDARGLVDDLDDGNGQPQAAVGEYSILLADGARSLCRRAPDASVIAVEGVEHRQVLADLAIAANTLCAGKPQYAAVMADKDSRGFLVATPAKGETGITVLGQPEASARAGSTVLSILVPGHELPVTVVLANGASKELAAQLRSRAKAQPDEAVVLLGAHAVDGMVDLTARAHAKPGATLPVDRVLVNAALLERYRRPRIEVTPLPAKEAPAQVLELE